MNTIQTGRNGSLGLSASSLPAQTQTLHSSSVTPNNVPNAGSSLNTQAQPSPIAIKQALDRVNKVLESTSSNQFQFSIDKATGIDVIKLVDRQSGEIIRQFPSKEILAIAESLDKSHSGAVLMQQA